MLSYCFQFLDENVTMKYTFYIIIMMIIIRFLFRYIKKTSQSSRLDSYTFYVKIVDEYRDSVHITYGNTLYKDEKPNYCSVSFDNNEFKSFIPDKNIVIHHKDLRRHILSILNDRYHLDEYLDYLVTIKYTPCQSKYNRERHFNHSDIMKDQLKQFIKQK